MDRARLLPSRPALGDDAVDFIGIDAWFPLSDWRDGFDHLDAALHRRSMTAPICRPTSRVAKALIGAMPAPPTAPRRSGHRSRIQPKASHGSSAPRICRPGGQTRISTAPAVWKSARRQPGSRARSRSASPNSVALPSTANNQPDARVDALSSESAVPHFSRGGRDERSSAPRSRPSIPGGGKSANNPVSSVYEGRMVRLADSAAWTWMRGLIRSFPN